MHEFPKTRLTSNTVLVHDWLTGMRGGERVLEILCNGFPEAPVHTLIHNSESVSDVINQHPVQTSFLQSIPGIYKHYRCLLPLFPAAIRSMPVPEADLMISSSHCVAKSHPHSIKTRHLCYCFTPMRYVWQPRSEYFFANPAKAMMAAPLLNWLRKWDRRMSDGVDRFVAISDTVRRRIRDAYDREADVVYPPIDLDMWTPGQGPRDDYDLVVSALVPYKRIDLGIKAYNQSGRQLLIVGVGGEEKKLKNIANDNIKFLGWQSDVSIRDLYRKARLLVFPGEEDFGLVPLEAQACGTPVVAYRKGGALETIQENKTGIFFDEQTEKSLNNAVKKALNIKWDTDILRQNAEHFSIANFIEGLSKVITKF